MTGVRKMRQRASAGEVSGEIAAPDGTPRTATATALFNFDALVVPAEAQVRAVSTDPETARAGVILREGARYSLDRNMLRTLAHGVG